MSNQKLRYAMVGGGRGAFIGAVHRRAAGFHGGIELVAEGEEEAIKELVSWAQHGPSAARVENVDVRWRGYTGEFAEFRIVE